MGNEHDGAAVFDQELLQPLDGLDVQVVGGLVEQQHVRVRDQRLAQQHAPLEPAGQLCEIGLGVQRQALDHGFDQPIGVPAAGRLDAFLQRAHALGVERPFGRGMVFANQSAEFTQAARDHVEHGAGFTLGHFLGHAGDSNARLVAHLAAIGCDGSVDQLEQRRLAGPVAPDQRDSLVRLDGEIHPVEQKRPADGKFKVDQ